MSQFIKAIEIDQTPLKMMSQWSSELAESANRESQRQQAIAKMRQEQEAAGAAAWGDMWKLGTDRMTEMTAEQRDIAFKQLQEGLAKSWKDTGGNPNQFRVSALTGPVQQIIKYEGFSKDIAKAAAEAAKQKEAAGITKDAINSFTAEYVLKRQGDGKYSVEDYYAALDKDIAERPNVYSDREKQYSALTGRAEEKGSLLERGIALDPTGTNKKTIDVKIPWRSWEVVEPKEMPNGLKVDVPRIKFENIDGQNVVTKDVFNEYIGNDKLRQGAVLREAKELAHAVNKGMGVNTETMTMRDFSIAKSQNPKLVDPFDNGVIEVYARKAVTDILKDKYDSDGYSKAGLQSYGAIKDDPVKNSTTINMPGAGPVGPSVNIVKTVQDKIESDKKAKGKNYTGTQVNSLKGEAKNVVIDMMKTDLPSAISSRYGSEAIVIKMGKDSEGKFVPAVFYAQDIIDKTDPLDPIVIRKAGDAVGIISDYQNAIASKEIGGQKMAVSGAAPMLSTPNSKSKQTTQTITKDAFRKMSIPDRQKFITEGGKVK
jgi:hypothetical protein